MAGRHSVLFLNTRFLQGGGAEKQTKLNIQALIESDTEYNIYVGFGNEYDEKERSELDNMGVHVKEFSMLRHYNPITQIVALAMVTQFLRKEKIDIIHTRGTEASVLGKIAARMAKTPIMIHGVRGVPFGKHQSVLFNKFLIISEIFTDRFADVRVADSSVTRTKYIEKSIGNNRKFKIINPGINVSKFRNATPADLETDSESIILFVGRLEKNKGVLDLLKAFENIHKNHDSELLLVGEGNLENEIKAIVQNQGMANSVQMLGYRDDVAKLMHVADIFVQPSYREGFSRVITEAQAAGLPIISTDVGAIAHRVEHGVNGYLIAPGDINGLEKYLNKLLHSRKSRVEMSKNAIAQAEEYDITEVKNQMRALYEQLLSEEEAP